MRRPNRVLNGSHTALVYMAALSGYETYDCLFSDPEPTAEFDAFEQEEVLLTYRATYSSTRRPT